MVKKILKKRKREDETKIYANGRIVVTPFSLMDKADLPEGDSCSMFFLSPDGKIVFDSEEPANEAVIEAYKILVRYPKADIEKWGRRCGKSWRRYGTG